MTFREGCKTGRWKEPDSGTRRPAFARGLSFTAVSPRLPVPFAPWHQTRTEPKEGQQKRQAVTTAATAYRQPGHAVRDAGDHEQAGWDDTGPEDAGRGAAGPCTGQHAAADRASGLRTADADSPQSWGLAV